jgi:hypothetical protein
MLGSIGEDDDSVGEHLEEASGHGEADLLAVGPARAQLAWLEAREQRRMMRKYPKLSLAPRCNDQLYVLRKDLAFSGDDFES